MLKKVVCLVGLGAGLVSLTLGGCDAIWPFQAPDATLFQVSPSSASACPQAPTITISGPALGDPQVQLDGMLIAPNLIANEGNGTLHVTLPPNLPQGPVQITLTVPGHPEAPVLLSDAFVYSSTPMSMLKPLGSLTQTMPSAPIQALTWRSGRMGQTNLAVLRGIGKEVALYAGSGSPITFGSPLVVSNVSVSGGQASSSIFSANLTLVESDAKQHTGQVVVAATTSADSLALFPDATGAMSLSNSGKTLSSPAALMVAGGYFVTADGVVPQVLAMAQSTTSAGTTMLESGYVLQLMGSTLQSSAQSLSVLGNLTPTAVATGNLNGDEYTDALVLFTSNHGVGTSRVHPILGGSKVVANPVLDAERLLSAAALAVGDVGGDGLDDAAVAISPANGGPSIVIYVNSPGTTGLDTPPSSPMTLGQDPIVVSIPAAATAVAFVDYDGDGANDIAYATMDGIRLLHNQRTTSPPTFNDMPVFSASAAGHASGWKVSSLSVTAGLPGYAGPIFVVSVTDSPAQVLFLANSCLPTTK